MSERLAAFQLLLRTQRLFGMADRLGHLLDKLKEYFLFVCLDLICLCRQMQDPWALLALLLELSGSENSELCNVNPSSLCSGSASTQESKSTPMQHWRRFPDNIYEIVYQTMSSSD